MYLIADAWKSKISWFYGQSPTEWEYFSTTGFNPNIQDIAVLDQIIHDFPLEQWYDKKIQHVCYLGAWCTSCDPQIMEDIFTKHFPDAILYIDNDLVWAAYAALWNKEWIVAILWTGSNTMHYDGHKLIERKWWHGILIWGEWWWMYLWNLVLHDYFFEVLPTDLQDELNKDWTVQTLKRAILQSQDKHKEIAKRSKRRSEHRGHPRVEEQLYSVFEKFFDLTITRYDSYQTYPLAVVGSVWMAFKDIVSDIATKRGITEVTFVKRPIEGLVKHYISKKS